MSQTSHLEPDEERLLEMFWLLNADDQSDILKQTALSACRTLLFPNLGFSRRQESSKSFIEHLEAALLERRPDFPSEWVWSHPVTGQSMEDIFLSMFEGQLAEYIFGTSSKDAQRSTWLASFYNDTVRGLMEDAGEDVTEVEGKQVGWVDEEWISHYIKNWRARIVRLLELAIVEREESA